MLAGGKRRGKRERGKERGRKEGGKERGGKEDGRRWKRGEKELGEGEGKRREREYLEFLVVLGN
jgi:hypothetical protein